MKNRGNWYISYVQMKCIQAQRFVYLITQILVNVHAYYKVLHSTEIKIIMKIGTWLSMDLNGIRFRQFNSIPSWSVHRYKNSPFQ